MTFTTELDGQASPESLGNPELQAIALEAGIRDASWSFPPELRRFAELVAERCASIVEPYTIEDRNAAEEIRAAFGLS